MRCPAILALLLLLAICASASEYDVSPYEGWSWSINIVSKTPCPPKNPGLVNSCQVCVGGMGISDIFYDCAADNVTVTTFDSTDGSCESPLFSVVYPTGCSDYTYVELMPPTSEEIVSCEKTVKIAQRAFLDSLLLIGTEDSTFFDAQ